MSLLVAGGINDPNLGAIVEAAGRAGIAVIDLRLTATASPAFFWDLDAKKIRLNGEILPVPGGAFFRHDVFASLQDPRPAVAVRALAWTTAISGWLLTEAGIRVFNRHMTQDASAKPTVLALARASGLHVPRTIVTNETEGLTECTAESWIAKPVAGGDYCHTLGQALQRAGDRASPAAMPAIVQPRLVAPEIRIYIIGQAEFAFEMRSPSLDYRVKQDAGVLLLPEVPAKEASLLRVLMSALGMDFGAADFKTDPSTSELAFLELNTSPMFAKFDQVARGQLCAAMVRELTSACTAKGIYSQTPVAKLPT